MEDQSALAAEARGVEFDKGRFDASPHSGLAKPGEAAGDGGAYAEFPPILIFQAALGMFDALLSTGYLGLWYLDPEGLAKTVVGVSGVPLLLGCLAVLTGGWIRRQHSESGQPAAVAAWTIFGMVTGLVLASLAAGFPIWLSFSEMM